MGERAERADVEGALPARPQPPPALTILLGHRLQPLGVLVVRTEPPPQPARQHAPARRVQHQRRRAHALVPPPVDEAPVAEAEKVA